MHISENLAVKECLPGIIIRDTTINLPLKMDGYVPCTKKNRMKHKNTIFASNASADSRDVLRRGNPRRKIRFCAGLASAVQRLVAPKTVLQKGNLPSSRFTSSNWKQSQSFHQTILLSATWKQQFEKTHKISKENHCPKFCPLADSIRGWTEFVSQ